MLIIKHQFIQHCITQKNKKSSFQLQFGTFNIFHNWHQCSRFFFPAGREGCRVYPNVKTDSSACSHCPGRWPSGLQHGRELPGMPRNPKVRVRLVSLKAAEHCCVSHCLLSASCVHHTMTTVTSQTIAKDLSGPRLGRSRAGGIPRLPWAGITPSANKLFPKTHE